MRNRDQAMKRAILVALVAGFLIAAGPPPKAIASNIQNGVFDPADYGWMRGKFSDATVSEKTQFAQIQTWLENCAREERQRVVEELSKLGIRSAALPPGTYQNSLCRDVASSNINVTDSGWKSYASFTSDLALAKSVADTFLWATSLAVNSGGPRGPELADRLLARPLGEQILRTGVGWGEGNGAAPKLSSPVRNIVVSRITTAIGRADRINTEYLKGIVDKQGWPKRSTVGNAASNAAWLLVQHADDDPVFQLRVLRLMEPLLQNREVSKSNHAYLYDRVMLKISGSQRFATQMTCTDGRRVPLPLEDAKSVDRRRAEAGLSTLSSYLIEMEQAFGKCPQ